MGHTHFLRAAFAALTFAALPALGAPPYKYYVLTPEQLLTDLAVTSLDPGNTISTGSTLRYLRGYESGVIPAAALAPGAIISGTARYTVGSNSSAADLLTPDFLAGTEFVIPHITGDHSYYVQTTTTTANISIDINGSTSSLQAVPGMAYEIDAGNNNSISGRITSDQPIVVAHVAYVSGVARDAYPVPPVSTEVLGIRSQQAVIGAGTDGTGVTVYASDGTSANYSLDAGDKVLVNVGANSSQGQGAAIRIVATNGIAAVQYDDGDGSDASAFWPVGVLGYRYALPVNAQYVAVACLASGVTVTLFKGSATPDTQTCSATGNDPGKLYFGVNTSGAHLSAGWYLHASAPIYVMHEASTPEDEHNLSGAQLAAGPSTVPTLNAVTTPTTSNPVAVSGTAGANASVRLYVNGRMQQTAKASGAGAFSFDAELFDGNNVIYVAAVSGENESVPSNVLQVVYSNTITRTQSGTISGNVVWTPGSTPTPYVISNTLTIAAGAKLVLQPGTTLRFANAKSLTVDGVLKIAGTAQSPVTFTSNSGSPQRGIWTGIVLNATAAGSEITGALIDYASKGIQVNGVAVSIRNSTIRNFPDNLGTGIWVTGAGASGTQIIGNVINGVGDTGRCIVAENSSPTIANNTLTNSDQGVWVYRDSSPLITGNVITSNDNGVKVEGGGFTPNPVVTRNQIYSNDVRNFIATDFPSGAQLLTLDATENWWGSATMTTISPTVLEWVDSPASTTTPSVNWGRWLSAADGSPVAGNFLTGAFSATSTTLVAGATYEVIGILLIPSGKSLTIPAGTTVKFHFLSSALLVDGTLTVQGTSGNVATLTSGKASPARGDWSGVQFRSGAGTGSVIEYALVAYAGTNIKSDGVPIVVRDSTSRIFGSDDGSGIWLVGAGTSASVIEDNLLVGQGRAGRCIALENSSAPITNNTMNNCDRGVVVIGTSSPSITGNTLTANDKGIQVDGRGVTPAPVVTGNLIYDNEVNSYEVLNNFASGAHNLRLDATGNWWGTTVIQSIASSIVDWNDSPTSTTRPSVDFSNMLNGPAGTPITGNYLVGPFTAASTTLTSGSVYQSLGLLLVPAGKSLTLQAGSLLKFYTGSLMVDGTLNIQGTSGNPATITSGRPSPARGDWTGIEIRAGSSSLIEYAVIDWAAVGVKVTGVAATIRYNTIRNFPSNSGTGVWVTGSGSSGTQILENIITGVGNTGRCIRAEDSSPTITGNQLSDCDQGVYVYRDSSPSITDNDIFSADNGIYVDGGGTFSPMPTTSGNRFWSNVNANFVATNFASGAQNLKLNALGNWWGTADPGAIAAMVSDFNEGYTTSTRPTVDFSSFLDGASGSPVAGNFILGAFTATSTTLVGGTTYDVLGTLLVPPAKTLVIPAGTTLRFHDHAALVVDGTMQVQGTSGSRVHLKSARAVPAAGDWTGIVVRAGATGVDIDQANIEWAVRGVDVSTATPTIRNSLIHRFSAAGIQVTSSGASTQILDNTIDNYTRIQDGIVLSAASPEIRGNLITRTERAIYMSGASNPEVVENVLTDNKWGIYLFGNNSASASAVPGPHINGNDIYANTTTQLEVNAYAASNPAIVDAMGNWWGTATPVATVDIRFTSGSVLSSVDFGNPLPSSLSFDSQPPTAPATLAALAVSSTAVDLSWPAAWDDVAVTQYRIERCSGAACTDFAEVGTSGTVSFSDSGLATSALYRYRVRAKDAVNLLGSYSPIVDIVVQVDSQAPTAPSVLDAASRSSTQIDLTWTGSTDAIGVTAYLIERCLGASCSDFAQVASVTSTSWRNNGLVASSTYRYRVRARDAANNLSSYSNIDAATTAITGADCD